MPPKTVPRIAHRDDELDEAVAALVLPGSGRNYRLGTYVRVITVATGNPRPTKLVDVVVRDPSHGNHVLAREESNFDYCTALPDPSGTGQLC